MNAAQKLHSTPFPNCTTCYVTEPVIATLFHVSVDQPSKPSFCTASPTMPFQISAVGLKLQNVGTRSASQMLSIALYALRAHATDYGIFKRNQNSLYYAHYIIPKHSSALNTHNDWGEPKRAPH